MPINVLRPGSAVAYWGAFSPNLEGGAVMVPIPAACGTVQSEVLSSDNAVPFVASALDAVAQIQNEPMNPLVYESSEASAWTVEKFPQKTHVVATASDGRCVRILPARVFGVERSLKAEIGFCGLSGRARVRQSVTVEKNHRHLVTVYEMKFSGAILRGVRDFLGLARLEPLAEVVARGLRLLGLNAPETMILTETPRRKGRRLEWSAAGVNAANQGIVAIWSQLDGPAGVPGTEEELGLYAHASRENNALPAAAAGLWNFISEWSGRHDPPDSREKSVV